MKSRGVADLILGWLVVTVGCLGVAATVRPLAIGLFIAWVFISLAVGVDLGKTFAAHRRDHRVVAPSTPPPPCVEPSGMILLPEADRDPRWKVAITRQRLQRSGQFHVNRAFWPLTDCPAGHYDYHELREGSLYHVVRRCAWCSPPAVWTEGTVTGEDSER